jgi:hypothetical protein
MKTFTAYAFAIGSALAASVAFSGTGQADMTSADNCASPSQAYCSTQPDPARGDDSLSRTEKANGFNDGSGSASATDERQARNPISPIDRRQNAGVNSSKGEGGDRGGSNR